MNLPHRPSGAWAWPLLLVATLPLALLLSDVVATLRGALDDATAEAYGAGPGRPPPSTSWERAATALSGGCSSWCCRRGEDRGGSA